MHNARHRMPSPSGGSYNNNTAASIADYEQQQHITGEESPERPLSDADGMDSDAASSPQSPFMFECADLNVDEIENEID